jgi:integrase
MSARLYRRLTAAKVTKLDARKVAGMHPDGDGLYLSVTAAGVASWSFRYMLQGRAREMGLGPLRDVSLAQARALAHDARHQKRQGIDPLAVRDGRRTTAALAAARAMSFEACARAYITAHAPGWTNAKHAAQWPSSLETFVYPFFGKLPIASIDTTLVMKALEPLWAKKPTTASRVRGRIESVLDWATARGYRQGENPARWKGHLENLLPHAAKLRVVKHHAALAYGELPAFMAALRTHDDVGARALAFVVLTAARSGEALKARWSEIDLPGRLWIVPAERMKKRREHRVPLSPAALAILKEMAAIRSGEFIFAEADGKHVDSDILRRVLRRLGRHDLTPHGFRSSFTDWCAERTHYPAEVRQMALAHVVDDAVEAAYRRGDMFEKRRKLGESWAAFCSQPVPAGEVVAIGAKRT